MPPYSTSKSFPLKWSNLSFHLKKCETPETFETAAISQLFCRHNMKIHYEIMLKKILIL